MTLITNIVRNTANLHDIESEIICEFAGLKTHLLPGEFYIDAHNKGDTWFKLDTESGLHITMGNNTHIMCDVYQIKSKTIKSYVCDYVGSIAIVENKILKNQIPFYHISFTNPDLQNVKLKRFFPLRNRFKTHQSTLSEIIQVSPNMDDFIQFTSYSDGLYIQPKITTN